MANRHVALLVEDDVEMAKDLGELLAGLGHAHIHAASREEAEPIVERGEFCYVLLDLQIKASADAIRAYVEAGQGLLELIRERYPRRNDQDKHRLPILVMSGHAKETQHAVRVLQDGADDFIIKPLSECSPPFRDKIQQALRKAGRERHERCAEIMRDAQAVDGAASSSASSGAPVRLAITGRPDGKRLEVMVGDKAARLTTASVALLLTLVDGRLRTPEGWVHKNDLGAKAEQGWKGISRLKEDLEPHLLPARLDVIENDKSGRYRLHANVSIASVDTARLTSLGDARIARLAAEIEQHQQKPDPRSTRTRRSRRP